MKNYRFLFESLSRSFEELLKAWRHKEKNFHYADFDDKFVRVAKDIDILEKNFEAVKWDNKIQSNYNKANTILLIFPTVIGVIIIIFGIINFSAVQRAKENFKSLHKNELKIREDSIKELNKLILMERLKFQIKILNEDTAMISNPIIKTGEIKFNQYYFFDAVEVDDSLDLKNKKIDLLLISGRTARIISPRQLINKEPKYFQVSHNKEKYFDTTSSLRIESLHVFNLNNLKKYSRKIIFQTTDRSGNRRILKVSL